MRYRSIEELPFVCQYNLPVPAQKVYLDAFNRAWGDSSDYATARAVAFQAVRECFEKDPETGAWITRPADTELSPLLQTATA
jgi:cation transport regulator ChaB